MVSPKYVTTKGQDKYQISAETFTSAIKLDYIAGSSAGYRETRCYYSRWIPQVFGFKTAKDFLGQTVQVAVQSGSSNPLNPEVKLFEFKVVGVIKQSTLAVINGSNGLQLHKNDMRDYV